MQKTQVMEKSAALSVCGGYLGGHFVPTFLVCRFFQRCKDRSTLFDHCHYPLQHFPTILVLSVAITSFSGLKMLSINNDLNVP